MGVAVMTTQEAESLPVYSLQAVANSFVQTYFNILYADPNEVHRFYEDSSTITRPNLTDGEMSSASTMIGIKNKILSLEYHSCKAEIASIDAQDSHNRGIIVLVTGFLIGEGEMKRSFTQTFFLAKHATGYFVLNDIFKFGIVIDEAVDNAVASEVTETSVTTPLTEEKQESAQEPDQQAEVKQAEVKQAEAKQAEAKQAEAKQAEAKQAEAKQAEVKQAEAKHPEVKKSESVPEKVNSNGVTKSSGDKKGPVLKEVVSKQLSISTQKQTQEPPKMSYASMLAKASPVSSPVKRSTNPVVVVAPSANSYLDKNKPAPQQAPPNHNTPPNRINAPPNRINNAPPRMNNNTPRANNNHTDGKSVYVGDLPPECSAEELEKVFRECGPIRKDNIIIRTYRDGFCYAIVEFGSSDAALKALENHIFLVGNKRSYVTEKRSLVQGKEEYQNFGNNRRSRENSVEGRRDQNGFRGGYYGHNRNNRNDTQFQNRGTNDFSSQNHWRNGGGEQRAQQNGGARQAPPTTSFK